MEEEGWGHLHLALNIYGLSFSLFTVAAIFSTMPKTLSSLQRITFSTLGRGSGAVGVKGKRDLTTALKPSAIFPKEREIFFFFLSYCHPFFLLFRTEQGAGFIRIIHLTKTQRELRLFWQPEYGNS